MKKLFLFTLIFILLCDTYSQQDSKLIFLTDSLPVESPVRLNLPVTNGYFAAERIAISPDGNELYYTERTGYGPGISTNLKMLSFINNRWSEPVILQSGCGSPALSPDGKTMYLRTNKKECYLTRENKEWSEPKLFYKPEILKHYLQRTNTGRYFYAALDSTINKGDIFCLETTATDTIITNLGFGKIAELSGDFALAFDESYIILLLEKKESNKQFVFYGNRDLFISFKEAENTWSKPVNLGKSINASCYEWKWGQSVTDDKKNLIFSSGKDKDTYGIYWINIENVIKNLRADNKL